MRHSAVKSWLNLLCTLLVAVSLFGAPGFWTAETSSTWSQASVLPVSKVSQHLFDATLPDSGSRVLRTEKPGLPGIQPGGVALGIARPVGEFALIRKFPAPRSIDAPSVGARLVGIVELRL